MQKVLVMCVCVSSYGILSKQHEVYEKEVLEKEAFSSDRVYYKYIKPIGPYTNDVRDDSDKRLYGYGGAPHPHPIPLKQDFQALLADNPLLSALLLSENLQLRPKYARPNHPDLPPINPFIALLLSQYGRYVPLYGAGKGIYAYQASNDYHNNKPFGSYKIYEDSE